ncbi:hypothetical protein Q604_UNBc4C00208G0001, partial [human gut metagenome]
IKGYSIWIWIRASSYNPLFDIVSYLTRRLVTNIKIEIKRLIIPAIKTANPIIFKIKSMNGIKWARCMNREPRPI